MKKKIQKPFDIEAAKNGAKVETRDGMPVRIICYDKVGNNYPIVVLLNMNGVDCCASYTIDGKLHDDNDFDGYNVDLDLVIIEEVEETKFNVGDWVFAMNWTGYPLLITAITPHCYELQDNGYKTEMYQTTVDTFYRLWTIKDAKPGDVLITEDDKRPFIFKEDYGGVPSAYCGIDTTDSILVGSYGPWTYDPVRPATYKERQQLFNRLEEDGYKWDEKTLMLSKIQKRWRDNKKITISGYFIEEPDTIDKDREYVNSYITYSEGHSNTKENYNLFATKKQAKSALAMARISQIMANDERFGGVITDKEWCDNHWRYAIIRTKIGLELSLRYYGYEYLAFHTREQAELFLKENEDLVKDYYMMD